MTGDGTINPSGATSTYEGAEYTLTITPTDKTEEVHVTNNGVDVTDQLVAPGSGIDHYTYTYTVSGDATIAATIGSQDEKYLWTKDTSWHRYTKAWKKVNDSWVEQSDLTTVFNSTTNYKKGN